jgi:hypothetical protein
MRAGLVLCIAFAVLVPGCGGSGSATSAPAETRAALDCQEPDYPGPWSACPQTEWVRAIVEAAGYEITGDTGSAIVAGGNGHSFYIWATPGEGSLGGSSRPLCKIGDLSIWGVAGGMTDWRYWHAQGFTFWISAGPVGTSESPDPCELDALARESQMQPAPGG